MTTEPTEGSKARPSRWLLAAELASCALLGWYVYVLLYPDGTERGMRSWSWASHACYGAASGLGRAGMACERRYLSLTNTGG